MTIREVAKHASVAIGTVSRVLREAPDVSPVLRERVEMAIAELGYQPYTRVRVTRNGSRDTPVISFILSNRSFLHPLHSRILQGVEAFCAEAGYLVLYKNFQYSAQTPVNEIQLPLILKEHGIADCVIAAGTNYGNLLHALELDEIPYVKLANNVMDDHALKPYDQVRFDDRQGAYDATKYLLELGHRHIWFVGDPTTPWCRSRYSGFVQAINEAGIEANDLAGGLSDDQYLDGQQSVEVLLERQVPLTAILAGTEETAHGVWESFRRHNLHVARDISLIGFDDQFGEQRIPGMTTVRVDGEEIGRQLAKMAVQKIRGHEEPIPEMVLPTKLIRRTSCRPVFDDSKFHPGVA